VSQSDLAKLKQLGPCHLEGGFVRLEPLRQEHSKGIAEAATLTDWQFILGTLKTKEDVERRIAEGLESEAKGEAYAFAVRLREEGRVVGSTCYLAVSSKHRRAEIGATWYARDVWGTAVNPECKYLLLKHAFEDWGAVRVQLVTGVDNLHSQRAITKLGAKFEGTLRNYGVRSDGTAREAALIYSIIDKEWPEVRAKLESRISSYRSKDNTRVRS
jgi:RimJ/RimL family protein N-acetyltransferase